MDEEHRTKIGEGQRRRWERTRIERGRDRDKARLLEWAVPIIRKAAEDGDPTAAQILKDLEDL